MRAKWPCCGEGIIEPTGWLEAIVETTTLVHAAVVARPLA